MGPNKGGRYDAASWRGIDRRKAVDVRRMQRFQRGGPDGPKARLGGNLNKRKGGVFPIDRTGQAHSLAIGSDG